MEIFPKIEKFTEGKMGQNSLLRSPKKEEQLVPNYSIDFDINGDNLDSMDDFEGILDIKDEDELGGGEGTNCNMFNDVDLNWDFMDCEEFSSFNEGEVDDKVIENSSHHEYSMVKSEYCGFWDKEEDDAKKMSLNLSLNYQDVIDSWSRSCRPLWTEDCSLSPHATNAYMGEVPIMEEERTRREASVLRYREKRQNRLFSNSSSKKIRYEVRKLNADKRPRLKGRFVKRNPEKILLK